MEHTEKDDDETKKKLDDETKRKMEEVRAGYPNMVFF
jgi:hypothetical protein